MDKNTPVIKDKILIVDDDVSVNDFLVRFFKLKGYTWIESVDRGKKALEIIEKEEVKLVLLDIKLPDIDGIEVLRKIKQIRKDIAVIMITGFPEEATAKEALKLGAYDYIMKPFDLAYLELCVLTKIIEEKTARNPS
jgi:DNA-binding NtrC family response regulator